MWRVSSFMFTQGRLAMPQIRRECYGTRHSSFLRGELWRTGCARKKDDGNAAVD